MEIKIKEKITATLSKEDISKLIRTELESQGYEVISMSFNTSKEHHGGLYEPTYSSTVFSGVSVELRRRQSSLTSGKAL